VPKNLEIIGLGYASLDYLALLPRIPMDDKVEIIKNLIQGGGPAATAIVAASRLGAQTGFIGAVGDDERGRNIITEFQAESVDTRGIVIQKSVASPAAYCWIDEKTGQRSIAWTHGSVKPLQLEEIDIEQIRNARAIHLDGHQTQAAIFAAEIARKYGVTVSLDAGTMVPDIDHLVELADIVIASEAFAVKFTGERDIKTAVKKIFAHGQTKFAGVTMGNKGSIGFDGQQDYFQRVFPVKVVDTTGAGDVFHGAFIYQHVKGSDWQTCMRFASAVAAIKCMKLGGRSGIPTLQTVERFISMEQR
jgi:ribokinase